MMRAFVAALIGCVLVLGVACGGGGPSAARPRSSATVEILEPEANAAIGAEEFTVRIRLEGGRIVQEASRDLTSTEGHVHVSVDGNILSQTYGLTQKLETPPAGRHLLQVEFVAKDHGPFDPRVIASVPFEVRGRP